LLQAAEIRPLSAFSAFRSCARPVIRAQRDRKHPDQQPIKPLIDPPPEVEPPPRASSILLATTCKFD
jgi:hypothetical protein